MYVACADINSRVSKILRNIPGKKFLIIFSSKDIAIITRIDKATKI